MSFGNAPENQVIVRMSYKHAILDNLNVAVAALSDIAITMENAFVSSGIYSSLCPHNCRQQIQGFGIAMKEAGIWADYEQMPKQLLDAVVAV